MATFVVLTIDPLSHEGLTNTLPPAKPARPMAIRQKLGRSIEVCRACIPQMSQQLAANRAGLTKQEVSSLELGHRGLDQIPLGKLHALAQELGALVAITLGDGSASVSYPDNTPLGILIRRGASLSLVKGN